MAGVQTTNSMIPAPLLAELEAAARAEGRTAAELFADALRNYVEDRKWESLLVRGKRRAKSKGLTEADIPRLIAETRAENKACGR